MNRSLSSCRKLCTAREYEWLKLTQGKKLQKLSEADLTSAVRHVRELRDKYRDLDDNQKSERKKAGKGGLLRGLLPRPQSRTRQKHEIFSEVLKVLTDEKKRRQESSEAEFSEVSANREASDRKVAAEAVASTHEVGAKAGTGVGRSHKESRSAERPSIQPPMKKISSMLSPHAPITRKAEVKAKSASKRILSHVSARGRKNQARRDQKHAGKE